MAHVSADRVRDTSTSTGTGAFVVSGTAPTAFRTFSAVLSTSDTFYYAIQHQTVNEWEVGLGTYSSANTITRTTVYASSAGGSAVTFSAGTKDVFITLAATRSVQLDNNGNVGIGTTSPSTKLDVSFSGGMMRAGGGSGNNLIQAYTGSVGGGIWAGGSTRFYSTGSMTLSTNATIGTSAPTGTVDAMTLDTSGNVGIGTSSPNYQLQLYKAGASANYLQVTSGATGAASGNGTLFGVDASGNGIVTVQGAVNYITSVAGAERMRIDSSGNVGIGTASVTNPQGWNKVLQVTSSSSAGIYVNDGTANWSMAAYTGQFYITSGANTRMLIDSSGNVGIGTASPSYKLDVSRASSGVVAKFTGTASAYIYGGAADVYFTSDTSANNAYGANSTSNYLNFYTNGSERARIDSSGNLLVACTGTNDTASTGLRYLAGSNGYLAHTLAASTNGTGSSYYLYSTGAGAYRFYVGAGGTVSATSTTISAISDQRLKENVRDLDDGLNVIMSLKPRKFDWKEGKGKDIKDDRGFIAQEFEQVFPDLIDEWKDPAPEGEEPYKAVRADLIPVLVKAIQELSAKVAALEGSKA